MASGWGPLLQVPGSEWMPAAGSATLVLTRRINLALENEIASVLAVEDARFDAMTNNDVDALQLLLADDLHYVHSNGVVEGKARSEEHTSELQSLMRISYAVFCLKKKKQKHSMQSKHQN